MHHQLTSHGMVMDVSFPREDIVRIRAGFGHLPADESWAVPGSRRTAVVPIHVTEQSGEAVLSTNKLRVRVAHDTLHVRIENADGTVILDKSGEALQFAKSGFTLRKTMPEGMHYFGLGDKTGSLDRRGGAFTLWNTDSPSFNEATDPLYKSIPFVLGADEHGGAFGLFLDNHWRTSFDFGRLTRDTLTIGAEGGPVDYYVMAGPDAKQVLSQYDFLTGPSPLMPIWALGFQQSHWSYKTQAEAQGIADRLRADRIPADAIYLDIDYQDRKRPFTVDHTRFPDLPGLVRRLHAQDLRLVLITDLHIAAAPGEHYAAYDSGAARDAFVRNPDGSAFVGDVWPGPSVFPDFSRADVRAWWGGLYKDFVALGVDGFWNDMNEPSVFHVPGKTMPLDVRHRIEEPGFATREATHAEMHNLVGMLNSRATYEGLLALAPGRRPFVLTRASAAGGQRYAATWTGDNVSTWAHIDLSISMIANLGLSGFAYSGADIGGFGGAKPSPDLLTRWIEIGAFNPLFRDHYMEGKPAQEVWVDGPEHEAIRRRFIEERYRLLPYLYSLAEENSRTGLPILRPVFLEFPQVLGWHLERNETPGAFMLGPDLLVAPSPALESPEAYRVLLPGDGWYDYWTGARISGHVVELTPRIDELPVFVRPGAIIARQAVVQSTSQRPAGNLMLDIYPGPATHGSIYADDGLTLAYRQGGFYRRELRCKPVEGGYQVVFSPVEGHYEPWWSAIDVHVQGAGQATLAENGAGTELLIPRTR